MGQFEHFLKNPGLWGINFALRTRTPGGGGWLNADKGGGGVKNWQNFADVFYGWPLMVM